MAQSRQTAFKVRIHDLKKGDYKKDSGEWEPNYVLINDNKISRVNLIAAVVMKNVNPEQGYASLQVDDGTESIRIKAWREDTKILDKANIGDMILIIGRIREYNNERYITPEIIKSVDYEWGLVRKKELELLYGELVVDNNYKEEITLDSSSDGNESLVISEEKMESGSESLRHKIMNLIDKHDSEDGADMLKVIKESGINDYEANNVIEELIKEGEIFQTSPGKLKLIN